MRIIPLKYSISMYSCSAYYIVANKNLTGAYNTLIDIGSDGYIMSEIRALAVNKGAQAVGQVILTHNHSDHTGGLREVIDSFKPQVYAFSPLPGVNKLIRDGDRIICGEQEFYILHTPGHSDDSICLYSTASGVLFSGDTSLNILSPSSSYPRSYFTSIERISGLDVKAIYPGHGKPILADCNKIIRKTLENVRNSDLY